MLNAIGAIGKAASPFLKHRKGILFPAGPFGNSKEKPQGPGMIVIRPKSMAEARRIAKADPFHKLGFRKFRIQAWEINERGVNINFKFSAGTYTIE